MEEVTNYLPRKYYLEKIILALVLTTAFAILSYYNFMLFHLVVELFSIFVAFFIFVIVYFSKDKINDNYLIFLGITYLFVGFFDAFHTLVYDGMNILEVEGANLATQLWIIARYTESISIFLAFLFLNKKKVFKFHKIFLSYLGFSFLILLTLYLDLFPDSFLSGSGLTPFKIVSEYIISIILIWALIFLSQNRTRLNSKVYKLMFASIVLTIFSEISFTFYIDVYGISNIIGHVFKLISVYLIFEITVKKAIQEPHDILFNKLQQMSFHDQLTGLYNRRFFENEMERLNNSRKEPISLIIGDIDNLKLVNDTYGHKFGDQYIKNAAKIFKNTLRKEDIVARIGGDEFAVLLPNTDEKTAAVIIKRPQQKCQGINDLKKYSIKFRVSLGYYTSNNSNEDLNKVFAKADKRMYLDKIQEI
ncbi:MAG: sensor domain-containing diguanylate cyclase [Bacillota bacterium]